MTFWCTGETWNHFYSAAVFAFKPMEMELQFTLTLTRTASVRKLWEPGLAFSTRLVMYASCHLLTHCIHCLAENENRNSGKILLSSSIPIEKLKWIKLSASLGSRRGSNSLPFGSLVYRLNNARLLTTLWLWMKRTYPLLKTKTNNENLIMLQPHYLQHNFILLTGSEPICVTVHWETCSLHNCYFTKYVWCIGKTSCKWNEIWLERQQLLHKLRQKSGYLLVSSCFCNTLMYYTGQSPIISIRSDICCFANKLTTK